jgi:alkyl hydroperoxide reductase subunit AhpC
MLIEADLSRQQYEVIRSTNKMFYICYSVLQKAKKVCYPPNESYIINETTGEIKLQSLLDLTATRLITYLEEVVESLTEEERNDLLLICKWGCDGSQQSQYKQSFKHD